MKIVTYKILNGTLNLFKLPNGKIVHIPTEALPQLKESLIPDIACYIQVKQNNGQFKAETALARISDLQEYSIEDAVSFFEAPKDFFDLKEL
ncbi:hypothetical protein [Bacteroides ovatus]|jgi:hypothetical protein|uniref:hypothetical protein n=1 Tax=Bacteroides ovatus TaxID=28116 RepID=UPI0021663750|nr:hypothetical protein [Bacteroides ovatus]MCS2298958.1 hypothetical protein [Bacteroides ovatus]